MADPRSKRFGIEASLRDVLTPAATRALMIMKGKTSERIAKISGIPEKELEAWLEDRQPILSNFSMERLQSVLGTSHGRLSPEKRHFFHIDPGRSGQRAMHALGSIMPGGTMHQIVGPSQKISERKISVYVLNQPSENTWLLIRHQKGWLEKPLDPKNFSGIHWARQTKEKSRIPVDEKMSQQLENNLIKDGIIDEIFTVVARSMGTTLNPRLIN